MISSDLMRGYNDLIILSILKKEASYGYLISKEIKEHSDGAYLIKETTLYSAFIRLEKNALIESFDQTDFTLGSKRVYYRVTEKGLQFLEEKKAEWQEIQKITNKFIGGKR